MKKTIALVIICLMTIMSVTACGSTDTGEVAELRQQVNSLEARISELEKEETVSISEEETTISASNTAETGEVAELRQQVNSSEARISELEKEETVSISEEETTISTSNTAETSEVSPKSNQQLSQYMDNQLKSNNPDNWLEVAQCDFAAEEHLLAVAKKCATLNCYITCAQDQAKQIEIANALSGNSATTDAVMAELVKSIYPDVWEVVALSNKSGETALSAVAEKCATLNCYTTCAQDKAKQIEIANALSGNSATTDAVMAELVKSIYPDVWEVVALSNKSGETALSAVAEKCATLNCYTTRAQDEAKQIEIANALSENPATTVVSMTKLAASRYPSVCSIGHQWIEEHP